MNAYDKCKTCFLFDFSKVRAKAWQKLFVSVHCIWIKLMSRSVKELCLMLWERHHQIFYWLTYNFVKRHRFFFFLDYYYMDTDLVFFFKLISPFPHKTVTHTVFHNLSIHNKAKLTFANFSIMTVNIMVDLVGICCQAYITKRYWKCGILPW